MESRVTKYRTDDTTNLSRIKKNQSLYKSMNEEEIENFNVDSNTTVLDENKNTIDIEKLKSMLDKKYRTNERKFSLNDGENEEINRGVNLDETREYDINQILNKAKEEKEIDYEVERLKKLRNTSLDILNDLDFADNDKENNNRKEESEHLKKLIDTINMKEALNSEESDPLELLSDLKGDDDATKVLGAKEEFLNVTTKEAPIIKNIEKVPLEEPKSTIDTNLTTSNIFTESDFDDFNDLKEEVASNKIVIKLLIAIIFISFLIGVVFVLNKYLNLGWF